jgi:hypothetical protein
MPTGIANEQRVQRLEHVGPPRAFGDAAFLDVAHQLAPCLGHLLPVGKRRRRFIEPRALDPGRDRDLVEVPRSRADLPAFIQPADEELGRDSGHGHRDDHQEDVQPAFLHGRVTTGFIDS